METTITQIRPRFKMKLNEPREKVMERIKILLKKTPDHINGKIVADHIILSVRGEELHYWSPQLNFRVEENEYEPGHSVVAGLIGPRPPVWTLFMLIYFSIGGAGLVISIFGFSKILLGESSLLIWALPLAFLFMLTAYKAGKYGESLGKDQVELLKGFVGEVLELRNI